MDPNANIADLRRAIKTAHSVKLKHWDAADLKVYPTGMKIPIPADVTELLAYDSIPPTITRTTKPTLLIAVAPKPQASQEGESQ
jgi:hypothetical protein